ncbi:IS66 family insertion sequence element accessory protein TnpA, partial [Limnospira sp. Paracas R14]|nr:hypothetical protein [Limnospira sp. Paracas R14]
RSKDTMFPLIEKWELSGQTQTDFAKDHNLSLSCFSYWRSVYLRAQEVGSDSASSSFIAVEQSSAGSPGMVELIFPSGARAIFYQANADLIRALVR